LEDWLTYWANRPPTKRGSVCARDWVRGVIKTVRDFVRWLNRSDKFEWRKPPEYEDRLPVRIKDTTEELSQEPEVKRYKRDELATLWEYATPRDRVFVLLALNCGFGLREIATLRTGQIKVKGDKAIIKRRRTKTGVWCKWVLWPETAAAL